MMVQSLADLKASYLFSCLEDLYFYNIFIMCYTTNTYIRSNEIESKSDILSTCWNFFSSIFWYPLKHSKALRTWPISLVFIFINMNVKYTDFFNKALYSSYFSCRDFSSYFVSIINYS